MNKVLALTDAIVPWHSFWIRFGQYAKDLPMPVQITDNAQQLRSLQRGDTLLIYRFLTEWGTLSPELKRLCDEGVRIITDIDDCLWQAPFGWDRKRKHLFTKMVRCCDLITCSTTALEELLTVMFPGKTVHLIRNSTPELTPRQRANDAPLTLCWSGAPWTRPKDLKLLQPLIKWIQTHGFAVRWHHLGHVDGRLSFADAVGLPKDHVKTTHMNGYNKYLNALSGDIGIAPVADGVFNTYKSEIKLLEYSAAGMAWIASETQAYRELCERWGIHGRLCRTTEDWIEHFQSLLKPNQLQAEQNKLKNLAHLHQNRHSTLAQWGTLIQTLHSY